MDHIELWDKAKALMREELANVSYTTWIVQPLKPVMWWMTSSRWKSSATLTKKPSGRATCP